MQVLQPATDSLLLNNLPYHSFVFYHKSKEAFPIKGQVSTIKLIHPFESNSLQKIQEVCQKDKYGCQQQKDIKAFSLDEVTKAIASLPMILKIHSVLMYHGISEDNT